MRWTMDEKVPNGTMNNTKKDDKKLIIHLLPDSPYSTQLIEFAASYFQHENHMFIIFGEGEHLSNIKPRDDVFFIKESSLKKIFFNRFRISRKRNCLVFIHYMNLQKETFVLRNFFSLRNRIAWVIWGGDIYSRLPREDLYDEEELKLLADRKEVSKFFSPTRFVCSLIDKLTLLRLDATSLFQRTDRIPNINHLARKKYFPFAFPIKSPLDNSQVKAEKSDILLHYLSYINKFKYKILLGNSGSVSNNLFTSLKVLEKYKNEDIVLVVPLSYGDKEYIDAVINEGTETFGNNFLPILDFLPLNQYLQIIESIDVAIWSHKVSEGFGNIRHLLMLGKKLYYRKTMFTNYERLNDWGIVYNDYEELKEDISIYEICSPYDEKTIARNKACVERHIGNEEILEAWKEAYSIMRERE